VPIYWRRPLTRLEAALSALLVAIVIALFLERSLEFMELAERTAMELTVQHVNSALYIRRATDLLERQRPDARRVLQRNPFEFAGIKVPNLHPDVAQAQNVAGLERGYWVFERSSNQLLYLPQLHRRLETDGAPPVVRFHLVGAPENAYLLVPAVKYSWH